MTRPDRQWQKLVRRLRALPETAMRRQVLLECMPDMDAAELLSFFAELLASTSERRPAYLGILDAVHEAILSAQLQDPLYELLSEVYRLAQQQNQDGVAGLLMMARPQRGPLTAKEVPADLEFASLSLGRRKFLARGHDRTKLDRLIFDPEPAVIHNLLRNPHLVELDVIRLAARRPTREEIQREIYASDWANRYRVRLALVCNPYTPTDMAIKLLGFLLRKDINMVRKDTALHALVQTEANRRYQEKK